MRDGESIGPYRIVRILGRGGMGITYEAERAADGMRVALKELHLSRVHDWKVLELFEREARVLANITHPAVPEYIDHFSVEGASGPAFYLVQQLAPGPSLAQRVAGGWRADEAESKRIAEALLDVLDYLHARRPPVFHRDIKPQNVILGEGGKVWLVDFGSVRDVYETTAGGSTIAGTLGYMGAEQLRGIARPESDLHGLAATILFALSGQSPGDMPQTKLRIDFRSRVRVTPAFAGWLEKMLEPAPEDRFPSARLALVALGDPSAMARGAPGMRTRTVVLSAALALVIAAGAAAAFVGMRGAAERLAHAATLPKLPERPPDWRFPAARRVRTIPAHFSAVKDAAFTPDGARLLTASFDDTVKIWDAHTGQAIRALPGHRGRVAAVRVTPDGRYAVTAADRTIRTWSLPDGKLARSFDVEGPGIFSLGVSPSGHALVGGTAGQARVWTLEGNALLTLPHGEGRVLSVSFSPDGTRIVTAGDDKTIKIWDALDGKLQRALVGHTAAVNEAAVAPDGQVLASASDDHTVRLWLIESGISLATLPLHTDEVWALAFAPDGSTLVSGGKDAILGVWALPTATLKQKIVLGASEKMLGLAFAPDGVTFATTFGNGVVGLWRLLGGASRVALPEPKIVAKKTSPTATAEERRYADAMDLMESTEGDHRVFDAVDARLRGLLKDNPRSALAYAGLARVAFRRAYLIGDKYEPAGLRQALDLAAKAIDIDPALPDAYCIRGWAAHESKDAAGAQAAAAMASKLAPTMPRVSMLAAELAIADGDLESAEKVLRSMLSRPVDKDVASGGFATLADIYERMGDLQAADGASRRHIELEPGSAWAKGNYANFLLRKGDYDSAIAMAKTALSQREYGAGRRTLSSAYCLKGEQLLWDRGDTDAATRAFQEAQGADASYSRATYDLGANHQYIARTRNDARELDQAMALYAKAVALDPENELAKGAIADFARR